MAGLRFFRTQVYYALAVVFILLPLYSVFGERGLLHLQRLRNEKKALDEKILYLQEENQKMRDRTYRIQHDERYLEKIVREELGWVKPGEIVYRFSSNKKIQRDSTPARENRR